MSDWKVFLNGKNFLLEINSEPQKVGWYTTRYVEAPDAQSAELAAVEEIRSDPNFSDVLNEREDPSRIYMEDVEEVLDRSAEGSDPGFAFYVEDESS